MGDPAPTTHDVIVIGAGPAGSAAAITARRAGLSVALIDKARFPRDKLCGGGVSGRSARFLGEIFGRAVSPDLFHTCTRVRLTGPAGLIGVVENAPPFHMAMRRDFDAALVGDAATAGAEVIAGVRIVALDAPGRRVALAEGRALSARVLIGADGVGSQVARALFGRAFEPARTGFGLEVEAPPAACPDPSEMEVAFGAADWGYGWAFPKAGGLTLGVGGLHGRNPDMRAHLDAYLARHGVSGGDLRCKGAYLPFGAFRGRPGRGAVLLAGDAAGLVDPITGEGIAWAMKSGQRAAEAAARAIAAGREASASARYCRGLAPVLGELRRARALRGLIYARGLQPLFTRMLAADPRLQRRYLGLVAGEFGYTDLGAGTVVRLLARIARSGPPRGRRA